MMGRSLHASASSQKKRPSRNPSKRISLQVQHGEIIIGILLTVVALILSAFSLGYSNNNATNGYQLKRLQESRSMIQFEIETFEMEIADLGSLKSRIEAEQQQEVE